MVRYNSTGIIKMLSFLCHNNIMKSACDSVLVLGTHLNHEIFYYSVQVASFISNGLFILQMLASAKCLEIGRGFGTLHVSSMEWNGIDVSPKQ